MSPERLAEIGQALFGLLWQKALARELGRSDRSVRHLAAGERAVTRELADQLAEICKQRGEALVRLGRQLEGVRGK